jgi:hypothetical protein
MYLFDAAPSWSREALLANVFISHTGADIGWAREIHGWLSDDGHQVFLDVDRHDGVQVGVEWERLLYERLRWADAVVCVWSRRRISSRCGARQKSAPPAR